MMLKTIPELMKEIHDVPFAHKLAEIYNADAEGVKAQQERYLKAIDRFCEIFDAREQPFSARRAARKSAAITPTISTAACWLPASIWT